MPSRQTRSSVLRRELVGAYKAARRTRHRRRLSIKGLALAGLAGLLFVFGAGVGIVQLTTNQKVKTQVQTLAAHTGSEAADSDATDIPSEAKPPTNSVANHRVAPDLPRTITIKKLGVNARIVRIGVTADSQLKTPTNIYDVGWYDGSAKPGEQGAVLLDGHVHGPTQPGVFVGLKKLVAGDELAIQLGNGTTLKYHVVKSQSYNKTNVDMGAAFSSVVPGKPGLNLITCDGSYNQAGEYANRLIVFAVQD